MEGMEFSKVMEVPGRKKLRLQVCITQSFGHRGRGKTPFKLSDLKWICNF